MSKKYLSFSISSSSSLATAGGNTRPEATPPKAQTANAIKRRKVEWAT
ncbi:hypothetical protein [Lewinella sp. 4G2]|nr:hypothetical protein [Lewinella sp. 4G2]